MTRFLPAVAPGESPGRRGAGYRATGCASRSGFSSIPGGAPAARAGAMARVRCRSLRAGQLAVARTPASRSPVASSCRPRALAAPSMVSAVASTLRPVSVGSTRCRCAFEQGGARGSFQIAQAAADRCVVAQPRRRRVAATTDHGRGFAGHPTWIERFARVLLEKWGMDAQHTSV